MNVKKGAWYAYSLPSGTRLRCAACQNEIDLDFPTADHHPRVCPACGTECAFLNWRGRIVQVLMARAPRPLVEAIRWSQSHLDELEYVELTSALEEVAGALKEKRKRTGRNSS